MGQFPLTNLYASLLIDKNITGRTREEILIKNRKLAHDYGSQSVAVLVNSHKEVCSIASGVLLDQYTVLTSAHFFADIILERIVVNYGMSIYSGNYDEQESIVSTPPIIFPNFKTDSKRRMQLQYVTSKKDIDVAGKYYLNSIPLEKFTDMKYEDLINLPFIQKMLVKGNNLAILKLDTPITQRYLVTKNNGSTSYVPCPIVFPKLISPDTKIADNTYGYCVGHGCLRYNDPRSLYQGKKTNLVEDNAYYKDFNRAFVSTKISPKKGLEGQSLLCGAYKTYFTHAKISGFVPNKNMMKTEGLPTDAFLGAPFFIKQDEDYVLTGIYSQTLNPGVDVTDPLHRKELRKYIVPQIPMFVDLRDQKVQTWIQQHMGPNPFEKLKKFHQKKSHFIALQEDSSLWAKGIPYAGNILKINKVFAKWDSVYNDIDIYSSNGKHLGAYHPITGNKYCEALKTKPDIHIPTEPHTLRLDGFKIKKHSCDFWKDAKVYKEHIKYNAVKGVNCEYYIWNDHHNDIEAFDFLGNHLGCINPCTDKLYTKPIQGKKIGFPIENNETAETRIIANINKPGFTIPEQTFCKVIYKGREYKNSLIPALPKLLANHIFQYVFLFTGCHKFLDLKKVNKIWYKAVKNLIKQTTLVWVSPELGRVKCGNNEFHWQNQLRFTEHFTYKWKEALNQTLIDSNKLQRISKTCPLMLVLSDPNPMQIEKILPHLMNQYNVKFIYYYSGYLEKSFSPEIPFLYCKTLHEISGSKALDVFNAKLTKNNKLKIYLPSDSIKLAFRQCNESIRPLLMQMPVYKLPHIAYDHYDGQNSIFVHEKNLIEKLVRKLNSDSDFIEQHLDDWLQANRLAETLSDFKSPKGYFKLTKSLVSYTKRDILRKIACNPETYSFHFNHITDSVKADIFNKQAQVRGLTRKIENPDLKKAIIGHCSEILNQSKLFKLDVLLEVLNNPPEQYKNADVQDIIEVAKLLTMLYTKSKSSLGVQNFIQKQIPTLALYDKFLMPFDLKEKISWRKAIRVMVFKYGTEMLGDYHLEWQKTFVKLNSKQKYSLLKKLLGLKKSNFLSTLDRIWIKNSFEEKMQIFENIW